MNKGYNLLNNVRKSHGSIQNQKDLKEIRRSVPKHNELALREPEIHAGYTRQIKRVSIDNFQWPGIWSQRLTGLLAAISRLIASKFKTLTSIITAYEKSRIWLQGGHSINNERMKLRATGVAQFYYISWKG